MKHPKLVAEARMVLGKKVKKLRREGILPANIYGKDLASTDLVSGEKKYKDPFKFTPTHTLVLYTNHLPKVGANDDGTWRRLIVIPFQAKIKGKADIKNYADYLVEHAGVAILS